MELLSESVSPVSSVSPLIDIDQVGGLNVVRDAIRVRVAASVHNISRRESNMAGFNQSELTYPKLHMLTVSIYSYSAAEFEIRLNPFCFRNAIAVGQDQVCRPADELSHAAQSTSLMGFSAHKLSRRDTVDLLATDVPDVARLLRPESAWATNPTAPAPTPNSNHTTYGLINFNFYPRPISRAVPRPDPARVMWDWRGEWSQY
ncbi:hypothetical protein B0H14DRAFT_2605498 [Mycena olivaceomarginata]|nr:hypothetical protein B0H14DRAFT_2605498 [Mycena olivaceomarginata]